MQALSAFICKLVGLIIQPLIILLVTAGVAYFIWGVMLFLWNSSDSKQREEGNQHLLWGVVGIVIMVAVVGILRIVTATFGVQMPFSSC